MAEAKQRAIENKAAEADRQYWMNRPKVGRAKLFDIDDQFNFDEPEETTFEAQQDAVNRAASLTGQGVYTMGVGADKTSGRHFTINIMDDLIGEASIDPAASNKDWYHESVFGKKKQPSPKAA